MARLKETYYETIVDAMTKKFGYKNVMEVPKLEKIVINMGIGEAKENPKVLENAVSDMEIITGQKAVLTKAKKSVANFKIREGMNIGCKTTLRGEKMYEFIFPKIEYDKIDKTRGMDVIIVTTAKTDEEARELLTLFNMPFAKQ